MSHISDSHGVDSAGSEPIDELKPEADVQEQRRDGLEEPLDPEAPADAHADEELRQDSPQDATIADVAEQRREVPTDDERREE